MDGEPFTQKIQDSLKALLVCSHGNTRVVEGKTFCPDCGVGVVFRWVVLRCTGCNQRRPGRYWLKQIVPVERCCTYCGEHGYETQNMENPSFYQIRHAMLAIEAEEPSQPIVWDTNNPWLQVVQGLSKWIFQKVSQP